MTQQLPPPIPSCVPETAPFSEEQRAWLNGFFAGFVSLDPKGITPLSADQAAALLPGMPGAKPAARTKATRPGTTRPCRSPSA